MTGLLILYGVRQTLGEQGSTFFMIRRLGWGEVAINNVGAIGNIVFGIASLFVGGPVIDRFGPRRVTLVTALGGVAATVPLVLAPDRLADPVAFLSLAVVGGAFGTLFYLSHLVHAMRVCTPAVAATSFALIMALNAGGGTTGGALLAPPEALGGLGAIFAASAVLMLFAGLLPLFGSRHLGRIRGASP